MRIVVMFPLFLLVFSCGKEDKMASCVQTANNLTYCLEYSELTTAGAENIKKQCEAGQLANTVGTGATKDCTENADLGFHCVRTGGSGPDFTVHYASGSAADMAEQNCTGPWSGKWD